LVFGNAEFMGMRKLTWETKASASGVEDKVIEEDPNSARGKDIASIYLYSCFQICTYVTTPSMLATASHFPSSKPIPTF
jgi:hypothetical protein